MLAKFCWSFYLAALSLSIPTYFVFYGASGHQIKIDMEDALYMISIVGIIIFSTVYLVRKRGTFLKYLLSGLLMFTLIVGLKIFWFLLQFSFGDDVDLFVIVLSFLLPFIFIVVNILNLREIFVSIKQPN